MFDAAIGILILIFFVAVMGISAFAISRLIEWDLSRKWHRGFLCQKCGHSEKGYVPSAFPICEKCGEKDCMVSVVRRMPTPFSCEIKHD